MADNKLEQMTQLVQDYRIKVARALVEMKREELARAEARLEKLKNDDSEAQNLAQGILDIAEQIASKEK